MLQLGNITELTETDIPALRDKILPILQKRKRLHDLYTRKADDKKVMFSESGTNLPFEKLLTDIAAGYTSGKPTYTVEAVSDEEKQKILTDMFDKPKRDDNYVRSMQLIIKEISNYNDDETENYDLIHDLFEMGACYELVYENEHNEIIYSTLSPLQTVAIWDYSVPANLIGLVRYWKEKNLNGTEVEKIELIDKDKIRIYNLFNNKETKKINARLENQNPHFWNDVPATCVENDFSIFEPCEDVINAYEQTIQNVRNTYQYNDKDCKLKITGYQPENEATIVNEQGNVVPNPARIVEDEMWVNAKAIYVGENGDVSWLEKKIDSKGFVDTLKTYSDLAFQLGGVPNTSDLSFNNANLNTSAIDRKFYIMKMMTTKGVDKLKKEKLRRWELIFNRINLKKSTDFDFRDIVVDIPKNLPANDDELISSLLKLKGTISEETIVNKLGYDYTVERKQMDDESYDKVVENIEKMEMMRKTLPEEDVTKNSLFASYDTSKKGVERDEMEQTRQETQTNPTEIK